MTKVGNLRIWQGCCGKCTLKLGPAWYWAWFPQMGCLLMIGGILVMMTLSLAPGSTIQAVSWTVIALEATAFISLIFFSEPGIPKQILRKAKELEDCPPSNQENLLSQDQTAISAGQSTATQEPPVENQPPTERPHPADDPEMKALINE